MNREFEIHFHLAIFIISHTSTPCYVHLLLEVTLPTKSSSISKLDEMYRQTLTSVLIKP